MPGREHAEQVVERRADVAHVDLDVRERGRAERDHDLARARGVRRRGLTATAARRRARARAAPARRSLRTASVPSPTAPSRVASLSTPITARPRSANDSASGKPTRPRPTPRRRLCSAGSTSEPGRISARGRGAAQLARQRARRWAAYWRAKRGDEPRVVAGVATPQPARLARQAVEPTPGRCAASRPAPGRRVRRGSRRPRPTPTSIGAARRGRIRCIHAPAWADRSRPTRPPPPRRRCARDARSSSCAVSSRNGGEWPPAISRPGKRSRRRACSRASAAGVASAVEVDRRAAARRARAEARHQVGTVDARRVCVAERAKRPHERLAVGHRERRVEHRGRVSACSCAAITRLTAAAVTYARPPRATVCCIQSSTCP